ncbi:helix-turn-helix domain-containing protein [Flavobacterium sp. 9AF]|uniref:helix-turn-helix domain-containing protein n=1 Tax=Flavobacterium sp. 9AF TaxID=2653142 RepID=UPI001358A3F1|nr:helix-turn-helix transcriptional regulator [Flavobacterium sp. 9AF]
MEKKSSPQKEPEYIAIANRLKSLRKEKGYKNYEHIAYDLEMSRSAYWRLEQGVNFEIKTLIKICKLLKVSLAEFFKEIDLPE